MEIKRTKVNTALEKRILIGMIVSDHFLTNVVHMYRPDFWNGSGAGTVAGWCINYWKKYEKAPGKHIQDIFEEEERKGRIDDSHLKFIELLLTNLSTQYEEEIEKYSSEYLLDQAEKWFKKRSLELLTKDIQSGILQENVEGAEEKLLKYNPVKKGEKTGIDPFSKESAAKMFEVEEEKPLFHLKGTLDKMFAGQLLRGTLISFQAPEKRGKSWFLLEVAMRAYRSRCNVVLFDTGDMTEKQIQKRICTYLSHRPVLKGQVKVQIPKFVRIDKRYKVEYATEIVNPLSHKEAVEIMGRWSRMGGGKRRFVVSTHSNGTLSTRDIKRILDDWKKGKAGDGSDSFVPDVIIIDYSDIMAPEDPKKDFRQQQNDRWQALRSLSQERDCCVITATQAAASSYEKKTIGLKDFSEDKRKYSHVTATYTLNQEKNEKSSNILRVDQLLVRDGAGFGINQVSVLQCLELGMPYVDSAWARDVELTERKDPEDLDETKE